MTYRTGRSEEINELALALSLAQGQIKSAPKDAKVGGKISYKYATLDSIWDACRKPLSDNGLAVVQLPTNDDEGLILETVLMHSSGQWISSKLILPQGAGRMSELQAMGSALTYARRYMLGAIVGITTGDDDDGQRASVSSQVKSPVLQFPHNNPTQGEFLAKAKDAGFRPEETAKILKDAGFNGYDLVKVPEMWDAITAAYEKAKAEQDTPMSQATAEQTAMAEVEAMAMDDEPAHTYE